MCRYMVLWHGPPGAGKRQGAAGRLLVYKDNSGHSAWRCAHPIHLRLHTSVLKSTQSTVSRILGIRPGHIARVSKPLMRPLCPFCHKVLTAVSHGSMWWDVSVGLEGVSGIRSGWYWRIHTCVLCRHWKAWWLHA